ncbi:MAG TPA: DNA-binding protein WhiA [Euzebyales bacterium]
MSLTAGVRAELAALPLPRGVVGRSELSGLLRFSGVMRRHGGADEGWTWASTLSPTPARRADRLASHLFDQRLRLRARRVRAPRPGLLVELEVPPPLLPALALDVVAGRRRTALPPWLDDDAARWAYVRGVALARLRLAQPHRAHCEVEAPTELLARELMELLEQLGVRAAASPHVRDRWRVVCKSRGAIGTLLAGTGATTAYLRWEEERTRRAVRSAAVRGVNADRANAGRSVQAATGQVAVVLEVLAQVGLDELDDDLRTAALARLANPTASLGQLAELLDVSRATVSRRFRRLAELVSGEDDAARGFG